MYSAETFSLRLDRRLQNWEHDPILAMDPDEVIKALGLRRLVDTEIWAPRVAAWLSSYKPPGK